MDERSLSTKVFIIIEISSKKLWKQRLGTEYSCLFNDVYKLASGSIAERLKLFPDNFDICLYHISKMYDFNSK